MTDRTERITGGVDTHKHIHVAAALDHLGRVLGTQSFPTTSAGQRQLLAWLASHGTVVAVGIEGTGSWGKNLARHVTAAGIVVVEVQRPSREHTRRHGKSDSSDAIAAARAVMAEDADGCAKGATGAAESIRSLRAVRVSAHKARTACANQMHAVVVTAPTVLRDALRQLPVAALAKRAAGYRPDADLTDPETAARWALRTLARRYLALCAELADVDTELALLVEHAAPQALLDEHGVGTDVASIIVSAIGDNPDRFRSDGALAKAAGTAPLDASSGRQQRHRLNPGGNRELNNALWRIVIVRLRWHAETREYMARRTAEGKTKREIIRALKRYITRRIWKIYRDHQHAARSAVPAT